MAKTLRENMALVPEFLSVCDQKGIDAGVEFIRKHIFQEAANAPNHGILEHEDAMKAVARKYTLLDDFAIAVEFHVKKNATDATPSNITINDRITEVIKHLDLELELGPIVFKAFKQAGHDYVLPILETDEYKRLKAQKDAEQPQLVVANA